MPTWSTLHDVALLYLFLASDTDQELEVSELEAIITRLHDKLPSLSIPDLRTVVDEAAEEARTGAHGHTVRGVIESLKYAQLDDDQRRALLNDLIDIAHADGRLHKNEMAFIRALGRVWKLDPPEQTLEALYDLALIFLHMAHGIDGQLDHPELGMVMETMQAWRPDYTAVTIHGIVRDALVELQRAEGPNRVTQAVQALPRHLPLAEHRTRLLEVARTVAESGGDISTGQRNFLEELAGALGRRD